MKLSALGDSAVLIEAGDDPVKIGRWTHALHSGRREGITDVVPAYTTVAVFYDPAAVARAWPADLPHEAVCAWLEGLLGGDGKPARAQPAPREVVVPVCYEGAFAPDLAEVAARAGMSAGEVVRLHSGASYEVRAVGFSPGFPYLSGLPKALHTPRRASPRTAVPAGSVGIGGAQAGIYSLATPGGWNLVGRTPLRLFDAGASEPALLRVGDRVRFRPIPAAEFAEAEKGGA